MDFAVFFVVDSYFLFVAGFAVVVEVIAVVLAVDVLVVVALTNSNNEDD